MLRSLADTFLDLIGRRPQRRYLEEKDRKRRLMAQVMSLAAILWGFYYLVWHFTRINLELWYLSIPFFMGEIVLYLLFVVFSTDAWYPRFHRPEGEPLGDFRPSVDIFIPVCGEPLEVIQQTVEAATRIDYSHKEIYILDDAANPQVQALAQELGCRYLARRDRAENKAGNLNFGLAHSTGELVLVLDADQVPRPEILTVTLGYFRFSKVGFVQTAQRFWVPKGDPFGCGDLVFYEAMQLTKNARNAVISCGSGVIYRRQALESIGGFSTWNLVEDLHTSVRLQDKGWTSIYHNHPLTTGAAPLTVHSHYRQRLQWATDTLRMFFWDNPLRRRGLSLSQRVQYSELGLVYLASGLIMPLFALIPTWSLASGQTVVLTSFYDYLLARAPYMALMFGSAMILTYPAPFFKTYRMWLGMFPVYFAAVFRALYYRRGKPTYVVTGARSKRRNLPDKLLILPQLIMMATIISGIYLGLRDHFGEATLWNAAWGVFFIWLLIPMTRAGLIPRSPELQAIPKSLTYSSWAEEAWRGRRIVVQVSLIFAIGVVGSVALYLFKPKLGLASDAQQQPFETPMVAPRATAAAWLPSPIPTAGVLVSQAPMATPTPTRPATTDLVAPPQATPTPIMTKYTVVQGDTLKDIAKRYGVSLADLVEANGLTNPDLIHVGNVFVVPAERTDASDSQ